MRYSLKHDRNNPQSTTMKTKPLFTPTADGQAYDIAPAGVLLLLADELYGADRVYLSEDGIIRLERMILEILSAAHAGGFTQCDIFHTLLFNGDNRSERVIGMARAACAAAGNERMGAIFAQVRKGLAS
jgi:hypothetical protein